MRALVAVMRCWACHCSLRSYTLLLRSTEIVFLSTHRTIRRSRYMQAEAHARQIPHGPMRIREPGAGGSSGAGGASTEPCSAAEPMEADEDFARQLQAKLDAADARRCVCCVLSTAECHPVPPASIASETVLPAVLVRRWLI